MTVVIRTAGEEDEARCLDMIGALTGEPPSTGWPSTFQALLSGDRGEILVATEAERILGTVTVSYNLAIRYAGEYAQLEELIVDPAARGKNVGGLLVEAVIERARQRGWAEFGLYLMKETEKNRPFYEKYGFQAMGSEMRQRL